MRTWEFELPENEGSKDRSLLKFGLGWAFCHSLPTHVWPEKATKHRRQLGGKTSPPSMYARSHENDTKISPRALWTLSIIPLPQQRRVYGHMLLALQGTFPY